MGKNWKQAERDVAEDFEAWWQAVEPGARFGRTPGSGAFATARALQGFKMRGDVMVDGAERWPFCVEVKFRKRVTLGAIDNYIMGRPSELDGYWKQVVVSAEKDGATPLLVFRGNRMPWRALFLLHPEDLRPQLRLFESFLALDPLRFALPLPARAGGMG